MINWKVRCRNRTFWLTLIPLVMLTIQSMCRVFGIEVDLGAKTDEIIAAATPLLSLLAFLGIIVDPTTEGVGDSRQALTYEEPKPIDRDINNDGVVNEADIDDLMQRLREYEEQYHA